MLLVPQRDLTVVLRRWARLERQISTAAMQDSR